MLKGALIAFVIMLAAIPIPIAHFILIPLGPFIGGFFGGGIAKADKGKIIVFAAIVAGLMVLPVLFVFSIWMIFGIEEIMGFQSSIVIIVFALLIPYTWFGTMLGALVSYAVRKNQE
jgi:hypothetical protein|tara:strand:+ start:97 stop:447 length:351 start_codon:yes stop_codon:yes gene_type:complete